MAGGSTQQSLRKALGAIKDTTTVSLAKVNSEYKDLDIAVVKATNHVESPPKEKHVRTLFLATSVSRPRADVAYCIHALARRIAKTHNWTVALKSLMVIHRTLKEGDPTFREEFINYSRNRAHVLNLSNFKDDSSPNAWDYSAWVRTYALFLEERLECFRLLKYDIESEQSTGHSKTRELDTVELLEQLPALQQLLYRLMGCQPEGAAISNHLIQHALSLVFKESFKLYRSINDGIINLVDKFFEMQRHDALKALEIYKRAGQQAERLSEFYEICKGLDLARSFQFPTLEQPPQSFLSTMEEYVKEAPRLAIVPKVVSEPNGERVVPGHIDKAPSLPQNVDEDRDASPVAGPVVKESLPPAPTFETDDLLGLNDANPDPSAIEERNALALAIVPSGTSSNVTSSSADVSGGWNLESGATGWELALVSNPSNNDTALNNSKLAGGLDKLTLESLYDDAVSRRTAYGSTQAGSYPQNQVGHNPFEAGLAFGPASQHDPFLASSKYSPPSNVQMAAMAQQQHAMMIQQQMTGTQPPSNPFSNPYTPTFSNFPGVPVQEHYQNNPFGNPGLL